MTSAITGLHHLTAIATDPQANLDFYAGILGLRLVKKTVNFDDPAAYHFYYGDEAGAPGTILTFFSWPGASRGRVGSGQVTRISLSAPAPALEFWRKRLSRLGIAAERRTRFGEEVVAFADPDGIPVEVVGASTDPRAGWNQAGIPPEQAIRGLHTAELTVGDAGRMEQLLTGIMGHRLVRRDGPRARYEAGPGGPGRQVDVLQDAGAPRGTGAAGTIHHLAFRVADDADQRDLQETLLGAGYGVSDVRDRDYFRSIYYSERNGILFEIATDIPGFAVDEPADMLGTNLKLPKQFEAARREIESLLPPVRPPQRVSSSADA
jgi:glyoxalase family protein